MLIDAPLLLRCLQARLSVCQSLDHADPPRSRPRFLRIRYLPIVAVVLASLALPVTAAAQSLYKQAPGHFGGFGSDGHSITVADDFQLGQSTRINRIVWWGGYFTTDQPAPRDNFTVRIFADANGMPGTLVQTVRAGRHVRRTPTGDYVNPPEQCDSSQPFCFPGYPEYRYAFALSKAIRATTSRYWVSITNVPTATNVPAPEWLWEASGTDTDSVQRSFGDPVSGPWEPSTYNASFELIS